MKKLNRLLPFIKFNKTRNSEIEFPHQLLQVCFIKDTNAEKGNFDNFYSCIAIFLSYLKRKLKANHSIIKDMYAVKYHYDSIIRDILS